MRITFLLTQSIDSPGGGGRYLPLAKALVKRGYQVSILALHHNYSQLKKKRMDIDGVSVFYVGQMHVLKQGNNKVYFSPFRLLWITFTATFRLFWAALWVPTDVIQVCKTQPMNGLAAWGGHLIRRLPVVLDSDDYEAVNNRFAYRWQQKIVAWFEQWMPSFSKGIIVGNNFIAEQFISHGYPEEAISIVPNGVDQERFAILDDENLSKKLFSIRQTLSVPNEKDVVVYIGSMSLVSHAVDLLLEAFTCVLITKPDAVLVLVGAGEDFGFLQQLANELGINNQVRFVGRIPTMEIPYYYHLGVVSVDPMRCSIQAESSLSLKLLESLAAGVPCVTADIGDRKNIVGDAGLAVEPDNALALAEGMLFVLKNSEIAEKMHQVAMTRRERNWWSKRVDSYIEMYKRCSKLN